MAVGLRLPRLLFWAIILSATLISAQISNVTNFVDTDKCFDGLLQADANGDIRVEQEEYLTFAKYIAPPGFLADIDRIADAPKILEDNFRILACLCRKNGRDVCCLGDNAHLPIDSFNIKDPSRFSFLYMVCSSTISTIDRVIEESSSPAPSILVPPSTSPEPSPMPSNIPSISPTISPEPAPMPSNSAIPTATPELTRSPSFSPSAMTSTSLRPTTTPSSSPTSSSPSAIPTISPRPTTTSPSAIPTISPRPTTTSPSAIPTLSPRPTTTSPSSSPSSARGTKGIFAVARTIYTVAIVNGITENIPASSYVPDLIASMNVVAVEVAAEVDFGSSDGNRRRLEGRVSLPTFINGVLDGFGFTDMPELVDGVFEFGACPSDLANPANDRCEQIAASVGLFLDDEAPQITQQLYQAALDRAIGQGRLQDALTEIDLNSPVRILTGKASGIDGINGSRSTEPERFSVGATVGIAIGGLAIVVGFIGAIFIVRKREKKPDFDELQPVSSIPSGVECGLGSAAKYELDSAEKQKTDEEVGTVQSGEAVLGASKPEYGGNYGRKAQSSSIEDWSDAGGSQDYIETLPDAGGSQKYSQTLSAGYQGPGGRSRSSSVSSAGQESIYTSSIYSGGESVNELNPSMFGTRIVELGTDSTELDNAIVSGDWVTLEPTAAVLAANASGRRGSETSCSSRQSSIKTCDSSLKVMLDERNTAELHRLIEGGDWEGVIHAASTIDSDIKLLHGSKSNQDSEGSASGAESSHSSSASSSIGGSTIGSATGSGNLTTHKSTLSKKTSKNRDRAEVRR